MHTRLNQLLLVAVVLTGASAFAQSVRPRVMVIMDTSKSMKEKPVYGYNGLCLAGNGATSDCVDTTAPGGDYDPNNPTTCLNKFCAAKSVIFNTIPAYTDVAYIGLTTYYQYLVRADTAGNQQSTCLYDVLAPANTIRTFTSLNDYGGALCPTGNTSAAAFTACGPTASYYFPDSSAGGSGLLRNMCVVPNKMGGGGAVPALAAPSDTPVACASSTEPNCYQLVKLSSTVQSTTNCTTYTSNNYGAPDAPYVEGAGGVCAAGTYGTKVSRSLVPTLATLTFPATATSINNMANLCGTGAPISPLNSMTTTAPVNGVSGFLLTAQPTTSAGTGGATGTWTNIPAPGNSGGNGKACSANAPCAMYMTSGTPSYTPSPRYWYMFYNTSVGSLKTAASGYTTAYAGYTPAGSFQSKPNGTSTLYDWQGYFAPATSGSPNFRVGGPSLVANQGYTNNLLTGTLAGLSTTTSCLNAPGATVLAATMNPNTVAGQVGATARYTNKNLAAFGIANPEATLLLSSIAPPTLPATDDSPGWTTASNTYACGTGATNSAMPCDVQVTADTPTTHVTTSINKVAGSTASAVAPASFTLYALSTGVSSCPAVGNTGAAPAGMAWSSGPPGGLCTSGTPCTFNSAGPGVMTNTLSGACGTAPASYSTTTTPGNCTAGGGSIAYVPSSTAMSVKITGIPGSTCPGAQTVSGTGNAAGQLGALATSAGGVVGSSSGCPTTGACDLGTPTKVAGAGASVSSNSNTTPTGFSGVTPSVMNLGTVFQDNTNIGQLSSSLPGDCAAAAGTNFSASGAMCPGGSGTCTLKVIGMAQIGTACTSEGTAPCYSCQYQQQKFTWTASTVDCTYPTTKTTYTIPNTLTCTYSVPQWDLTTNTHSCTYAVGAQRADFNYYSSFVCQYQMIQTTASFSTNSYQYAYLTKGDELIGRGQGPQSAVGVNNCTDNTAGSATGTKCPATIPGCGGVTWTSTNMAYNPQANNATCVLRYGGGTTPADVSNSNSKKVLTTDGHYAGYLSGSTLMPTSVANPSCEAVAAPATPSTYSSVTATPTGFCSQTGMPAGGTYSLVSDWYDPSQTNTLTALQNLNIGTSGAPVYPFVGKTLSIVTNTTNKNQGFGGVMAPSIAGSGALDNSLPPYSTVLAGTGTYSYARPTFVPIPSNGASPSAQATDLKKVAYLCLDPNTTPPNADGTLAGGACLSDYASPNTAAPGGNYLKDFTPLYGALRNTYDYMLGRFADDPDHQCRPYYIILATDGVENTPKGYTDSDLQSLVASFRNTTGGHSTPDVQTYVIGFGSGAAGAGSLDLLAQAGGTNFAYSASSQATLAGALNAVFAAITQGTQSRSKPALSTDGTRLYAAQYVVSPPGADVFGLLYAYALSSNGNPLPAWELRAKLDDPAAATRTIKVALRDSSNNLLVTDLTSGNGVLAAALTACGTLGCLSWPAAPDVIPTATQIVNFLKAKGQVYLNDSIAGTPTTRQSGLAPIANSSPVVVGKSPFDISYGGPSNQQGYTAYQAWTSTRPVRVMFQSEDGMAHSVYEGSSNPACSTETSMACPNGTEAWALIPGMLAGNTQPMAGQPSLANMLWANTTINAWTASKLLNNTLAIADVCGDTSTGQTDNAACNASTYNGPTSAGWRTIAIGTQREGGRGIYAIDVTDGTAPPNSSAGASNSKWLWDYADGHLGRTYSIPAIGQVSLNSKPQFVAIFGGGLADGTADGKAVYVLNALTGHPTSNNVPYTLAGAQHGFGGWFSNGNFPSQVLGRPATWREPGFQFIDSAYLGIGGSLFAMRFADSLGDQWDDDAHWKPDILFDPSDPTFAPSAINPGGPAIVINGVDAGTSAGNYLVPVGTLPISNPPTIENRPKLAAELDISSSVPDLYVGTGDVVSPDSPDTQFTNGNYFYAIHDFNDQNYHTNHHGNCHGNHNNQQHGTCLGSNPDGLPLWVVKFPGNEQVVSEPAILSNCIVVATYTPAAGGSSCGAVGDTTLYGFHPITGALVNCLFNTLTQSDGGTLPDGGAGSTTTGSATSVIKYPGAGIPSDLVVAGDHVYLQTSNKPPFPVPTSQPPQPGTVRSYRRLK